jgi:hypothetical protein
LHCAARLTSTYRYLSAPEFNEAAYNAWIVVRLLLAAGANVQAVNKQQQTPLFVAASCANRAVLHLLLEAGAAVNVVCRGAGTPLHAAAIGSHYNHPCGGDLTVRALLGAGADPWARSVLVWPAATWSYIPCRWKGWKGTPLDGAAEAAVASRSGEHDALNMLLLYLESEPTGVCARLLVNAAVRAAAAAVSELRDLRPWWDLFKQYWLEGRKGRGC